MSLWPYSCLLGQQTTVFSVLTPSTRSTALPGRPCPHQATKSCSPTPKFLRLLFCPRATWGPCEYAVLISEQHRETFKPTGGNCLYLIIMYIHMHLVMFPATNNIDSLDTPFTTDPPVVKAVAKQKCVFVCARSPSAVGFPCMSSRASCYRRPLVAWSL